MKKTTLCLLIALFLFNCGLGAVLFYKYHKDKTVVVSPTDDSSQFVTLTDAVPDAILEIRYYGTYNFVGARIDGYEQPTAFADQEGCQGIEGSERRCHSSGIPSENIRCLPSSKGG